MADFDDYFRSALIDAVKERGAQARLSRDSGIGTSYINNIVKGRDSGSESTRRALATALGFSGRRYEDFLEIGRALIDGREPPKPEPPSAVDPSLNDFFRVPYSDNLTLTPGTTGLIAITNDVEDSPVILHGPTIGRANPWGLRSFKVEDEAMEPLIARFGFILVDLKQNDYRKIKNGEIYLLASNYEDENDGLAIIRQIEWAGADRDRLALKAEHSRFPTLYRQPREINVLGRIIWSWQQF